MAQSAILAVIKHHLIDMIERSEKVRALNCLTILVLFGLFQNKTKAYCQPIVPSAFSLFLIPSLLLFSVTVNAVVCPEYTGRGKDYTNPNDRAHITGVEKVHFTEDVRLLRKGSTGYLIQDIEFMLNLSPNHHQALDSLTRLALREGTTLPRLASINLECRFLWAEQIQPRDAMVPVIQGAYYYRAGKPDEAKKYLEKAAKLAPENPEVNYNLGLALYKMEDYENARIYARKAYKGGYPLPGLRNMLKRAGYPLSE
ncbi:MAG: tetratricopeptide repeat protein [Lamprobacter sp.]|uniref:tetratricopeptide repeat protein n=1 Tax=Lamprobacter sp. TaxID=3100796 RepID=UPI002B25982B|nr:tetratricopeptide repeat protein [Lamprobacter sp.]MEA3639815.1 tetratricopeptide repeat protein [Lamprobacter sp.]